MMENNLNKESDNYNKRHVDELEQKEAALLKIDSSLANIIIKSTIDTFNSCFGVAVEPQTPTQTDGNIISADYTGIIGMLQSSIEARISLTFSRETLIYILKFVYPEESSNNETMMKDAVEEILNVIYGTVKTELNKGGYKFVMTILP